jgi:hypothetical protein
MSSLEGEARLGAAAQGKTHQERSETRRGSRGDYRVAVPPRPAERGDAKAGAPWTKERRVVHQRRFAR